MAFTYGRRIDERRGHNERVTWGGGDFFEGNTEKIRRIEIAMPMRTHFKEEDRGYTHYIVQIKVATAGINAAHRE